MPETVKTAQPVSESRPLPSPTISQNFSRLIITGKPGSAPVTLSPTARNRTVSQWIKTLLPEGWKFRQENAATPKLNTKLVSWSANDQWTRSLNRLLEEQHLWGHLDWDNKTLTVTTSAAAPAQDTATTISPAAMVTTSTSRSHQRQQIARTNHETHSGETAYLRLRPQQSRLRPALQSSLSHS